MNFTAHDRLWFVLSADILPILKRYACKTPFVKANRCKYNTMSIARNVLLSVLLTDKAVIGVSTAIGNLMGQATPLGLFCFCLYICVP